MNIAIVVQRYGEDINGGAELHARWIAEHLVERQHQVTVITTCARDYLLWKNHYPPGRDHVGGIPVIRHKVKRIRRGRRFIFLQNRVFFEPHTRQEEILWVEENGPYSPGLVRYLARHHQDYDWFIFFSYRYYTTYAGLQGVRDRAILVPTAEEDPAINLEIFKEFFTIPRAFIYNSIEERAMIRKVSANGSVPGEVVGVGINVQSGNGDRFREKYDIRRPYVVYVGRIDKNKGCDRLFDYMLRSFERKNGEFDLVLVGGKYLTIPTHPRIKAVGFVSEQDKFDAVDGSMMMIIPSHYESLCMALLECWALKRPALVNGKCAVLKGQVKRSNGGLYYASYSEFEECLRRLVGNEQIRQILGEQGHAYFEKEYTWPVIMEKYERLLTSLST